MLLFDTKPLRHQIEAQNLQHKYRTISVSSSIPKIPRLALLRAFLHWPNQLSVLQKT